MKLWRRCLRGSVWLASAACVGYTFSQCVASPWRLTGDSMMPTFNHGQLVLCSPWPWCCRRLQRGDVIVARHPNQPQDKICKRILGLPDDVVETEDGVKTSIPPGHIWIEGDNHEVSIDSRRYGPIPIGLLEGKVITKLF